MQSAFQDQNGDGVPDQIGRTVTLSGTIITNFFVGRASGFSTAYLQDVAGGIRLVDMGTQLADFGAARGDVVRASGKIALDNNGWLLELEQIHRISQGPVPPPQDAQVEDLLAGHYLGRLVRLKGNIVPPEDSGPDARDFQLADQTGQIRIDLPMRFYRDAKFAKRLHQGGTVELVGIAIRYPGELHKQEQIRLLPRMPDDFRFAPLLPYREIAWGLVGVILVGKLTMLLVLRAKAEKRARKFAALSESLTRSEEELREANQRLTTLIQSAPLAITVLDKDGNVQDWNPAAERMLGWTEQEVLGRPLPVVAESRQGNYDRNMQRIRRGDILQGIEAQPLKKDGSHFYASLSMSPLYDAAGEVSGSIAILLDTTEHKRADMALRESEERYRQLFENAGDLIYTREVGGRLTSANRTTEQMTGYTKEELLGRSILDLVAPEHHARIPLTVEAFQQSNSDLTWESEMVTKDGERLSLEFKRQVIYRNGQLVEVLGIARDITERKRLQAQFLQAQKMEAVGRLAGGVAHDFNNLLNVIGGYSELLLPHLPAEDSSRRYVTEIQKASGRAASLIRQLLAFSRKQVLQPKTLDLNDVIAELSKMLHRLIGEDIQLTTILQPKLGCVEADPSQVEQVVMNLAVNARDAMPKGGTFTIETANAELDEEYARWHPGCQPGSYVLMTVRDTGVGMDAETRLRIFEPFFTTKPVGQGTGLGLSTVYGIVKQSGGYIWVYSEPGQGTTFKIYLPRIKASVQTPALEPQETEAPSGTETILVVEDEPAVRELTLEFLQNSGYHVLEADRGTTALELVRQYDGHIHLMLTDVIMPGMNGRELAEEMAQALPETKVVYMSAHADDRIHHHDISAPGTAFIQKPFSRLALARKVREVLDGPQPRPSGQLRLVEMPSGKSGS
ncbi:MAG: PAS domain S-box protein [Acidobacteria bacterium]|nr:PAS domain S-box protein [Acidobacteriota bacterium]